MLRGAGVRGLADVRRFPASRRHPHFNRDALRGALEQGGTEYRWFEALGGRRSGLRGAEESPNRGLRVDAFRAYADYALTPAFEEALASLVDWARSKRVAICCAEALWWRCHRRIVSDHLVARGHPVTHLSSEGKQTPHVIWELARVTPRGLIYPPPERELFPPEP